MKKLFKYFLFSVPLILGGVLVSCGNETTTPVYKGMHIESSVLNNVKRANEVVAPSDSNVPVVTNDIEDLVTIKVNTTSETSYYVNPGEKFTLVVELENPDAFEIQSFTLNGTKYANYMFKEGSDLEHLYLEVDAPNDPGLYEYTIDKIKYIDGEDIKDVDLSKGEQTIKAGIAYTSEPTAEVLNQVINTTEVTLDVELTDYLDLIKDKEVKIYLSDGEKIVKEQKLNLGTNHIKFDNLKENTTYQYGVMTSYDLLDGENEKERVLSKDTFNTLAMYNIEKVVPSFDQVKFNLSKNGDLGELVKVELCDKDNVVQTLTTFDNLGFKDLLSNHEYKIKVFYKYLENNIEFMENTDYVFKTLERVAPTVDFNIDKIFSKEFTFTVDKIDETNSIISEKISLYRGNNVVKEVTDLKENIVTGLEADTIYRVVYSYTYNLKEGGEDIIVEIEDEIKTSIDLEVVSITSNGKTSFEEGENISLSIQFRNPKHFTISMVFINDIEYPVAEFDKRTNIAKVNFINNERLGLGEIDVKVTGIVIDNNKTIISSNVKLPLYLDSKIMINSIEYLDSNKELISDYIVKNSEKGYLKFDLKNLIGYKILGLTINGQQETNIINDGNSVLFEINASAGINKYLISSIIYEKNNSSAEITCNEQFKVFNKDGVKSKMISTISDMANLNDGGYFELANDLDFADVNWMPIDFNGYLNGNGHVIKNINATLFGNSTGFITNLIVSNAYVYSDETLSLGSFITNNSTDLDIYKCGIDSNSIYESNILVYAGGFIGNATGFTSIRKCYSYGEIVVKLKENNYIDFYSLPGQAGFVGNNVGNLVIENSFLNANVKSNLAAAYVSTSKGKITINKCYCAGKMESIGSTVSSGLSSTYDLAYANDTLFLIEIGGYGSVFYEGNFNTIKNTYYTEDSYMSSNPIEFKLDKKYLNLKSFYIDTLEWSEDIWNFDDLDYQNNRYPTLK